MGGGSLTTPGRLSYSSFVFHPQALPPKPRFLRHEVMGAGPRVAACLGTAAVLAVTLRSAAAVGALPRLCSTVVLSAAGFCATNYFIPLLAPLLAKAGLVGKDINKKGTPAGDTPVPEALGLVAATIYLIVLCLLHGARGGGPRSVTDLEAAVRPTAVVGVELYTAALSSVTFMILLGFADDVLDLKWRYKLALPLVAALPLLVYYDGPTTIVIPRPLREVLGMGRLLQLGVLYHLYMALLSIFCTNAINIYAGINGLEAGQSVIIAAFVLAHNAMNVDVAGPVDDALGLRANHLFSIDLVMPFAACTLGLLNHNWFPSAVFVGDTFCYFAGMTFAMAAILGHFSETLLLLFIPQLINFVYSLPQLVGIVPCPRHRLPRYNRETKKLEGIASHLNLVNLVLLITGPLSEQHLCVLLLAFQVLCCTIGLLLRRFAILFVL